MAELIGREIHAAAVQRVNTFATGENFNLQPLRDIRTRLGHLTESWQRLRAAHLELMLIEATPQEREEYANAYVPMEETFLTTDAILRQRIGQLEQPVEENHDDEFDHQSNHSGNESEEHQENELIGDQQLEQNPLPNQNENANPPAPVNQPQQVGQVQMVQQPNGLWPWQFRIDNIWGDFDGDKKKWQAFHDSFKSRIYDDPTMPAVQKLQILKAALKGKAAKSLGEWQICDRNFEPAWQRLKTLYDDPYTATKQLFQKLSKLPKVEVPHGAKLQLLSNVTQEVYRQLEAMGYLVQHFEIYFIHTVQDKLDDKTSVAWDLQRRGHNPTLAQFTEFLDNQARALTNAYNPDPTKKLESHNDQNRSLSDTGHRNNAKRFKTSGSMSHRAQPKHYNQQVVIKTEKGTCEICKQEHSVRKCPQFLKFSLSKRMEKAKEKKLCFKCLSSGHMLKDCKFGPCPRCEGRHGTALCPENPNNRNVHVAKKQQKYRKNKVRKSTSSQ